MSSPHELREKAERYRRLAAAVIDPKTLEALHELAALYEETAAELEGTDLPPSSDTTDC